MKLFYPIRVLFLEFEYFELPDTVTSISCPGNPQVHLLVVGEGRGCQREGKFRGSGHPTCTLGLSLMCDITVCSIMRFYLNK